MSDSVGKIWLTVGLGLVLSVGAVVPGRAADAGMKMLHGHVPAMISQLQLKAKGDLAVETELNLAIGLPLRNAAALTNLLQQIYDPASTNYHRYLTPEQFTAQFGPTESDYQAVINFATANGLTVTATSPNRMLLNVSATASKVEKAFHVALHNYAHPSEHRDFFAPDTEPSVPSVLPILDIGGLDNFRSPHSHYKIKSSANVVQPAGSSTQPISGATTGSGPSGNYVGDDFRNAYAPGTALNGSGQTVALVEFDGYLASDIIQYENLFGRTNVPLQNVLIDGFDGVPTGSGGEVEVSLDIEVAIAMAPALSKVIVYEGNPNNFHPNNVLNRIATDNSAKQISSSWTWTGGPSATTDQIFQQMAVQGQTYLQCSTDFDAYPPGSVDSPFLFGTPADNPFVTSVGGTTLTMNGAGTSYASETVWNWGVRYGPSADGIGSSGGVSSYYLIPSWQTNVNMTARGGSAGNRNFPDVAMTGDDTLVIADGGVFYLGVGGTSIAAPLWAGFMALVNQQAVINNHTPAGFINPALYAIASGPNYAACFHDTTTGNNKWSGSPNLFVATNNYDLCTGLGTPTGTNLINALTAVGVTNTVTHLSPPPPPYGSTLGVLNGGNPNGTWTLFVQDDRQLDSGSISNGWILNLTTANPVGYSANLTLTMSASTNSVVAGGSVVYTLGVTNYGPSICSNCIVADTLPTGFTLLATNSSPGTSVIRGGSQVTWNVGTLAVGGGAQLMLTAQANATGANLQNTAVASANTPDPNPNDNTVSVAVNVAVLTPPQLSGGSVAGNGTFSMNITGSPVLTIIQGATNLVAPVWIPIVTNTPPFVFTDPNAASYPYRFYRAVTAQ